MSGQVVVDASIAVKWVTDEEDSDVADALLREWAWGDVHMVAATPLIGEAANALHQKIIRAELTEDQAVAAMERFLDLDIEILDAPELYPRALRITRQLGYGAVYDAIYLALAERLACTYWTADGRFYRRARPAGHDIRLLSLDAPE